jgi:hypothetical protein
MGNNCERGRVTHPATHLEIAQMTDDNGRFTDRTKVCLDHAWTKRQYEATGAGECTMVTKRRL